MGSRVGERVFSDVDGVVMFVDRVDALDHVDARRDDLLWEGDLGEEGGVSMTATGGGPCD